MIHDAASEMELGELHGGQSLMMIEVYCEISGLEILPARLPNILSCRSDWIRSISIQFKELEAMESRPTPHNNLFHLAMSHLSNARSLIETNFPP
ncbi:MAG: hypothetical protein Q8M16_19300 [Pirellulaceae bacterium]|nr:hypothetical protein [Pirellulaceae bacterium]